MGGGEVEQKLECDRKPGELEVEQDSGLPRARHPRRHLAGSSLTEYDDGDDRRGVDDDGA